MHLQRKGTNRYIFPAQGDMKADALFFLQEQHLEGAISDDSIRQLAQAATLPGTAAALGMPDIHRGFGLPIGGVLLGDLQEGVISAGAVGMDINCGVRILATDLNKADVSREDLKDLILKIESKIPTGIGKKSMHKEVGLLNRTQVLTEGAASVVKNGFGSGSDLEYCEEEGQYPGADPDKISKRAFERSNQLGTIGGGNHFIEIGFVEEVYRTDTAAVFGLAKDVVTIMIHTGSRGLGHQICNDYSDLMFKKARDYGITPPVKGLAAVPWKSREGRDYMAAMSCAVNFAFANRQIISHYVREVFLDKFKGSRASLVYDVAHNIAKVERVGDAEYIIHRKGATRALPPGHPLNPGFYKNTGHPAIIPGTMGTSSYIVTGTPEIVETYHSVNHGAGRLMSRKEAKATFSAKDVSRQLNSVIVSARDKTAIIDEAPHAYKDIHSVVDTLAEIGLTKKILRLKPLAVVKGVE